MADEISIVVRAEDQFSGVLGNFGSIITGIESAINLAGRAFSFFKDQALIGLDAIASYERLSLSLETLSAVQALQAGTAQTMTEALAQTSGEAEELLAWMQELAIKSPFTLEGVANAFRLAEAYGFTAAEAQRLTQAMINFAAGTGASEDSMSRIALALGQIQAKGKLAGQEVLQLVNAGLPVTQILAEAFGVTTAEIEDMRQKGLIPAKEAIEAITTYLETNFAGAAERQAESWAGLKGTFEDISKMGLREFWGGMFTALQPVAIALSEFLQTEGLDRLGEIGARLGEITASLIQFGSNIQSMDFSQLTSMITDWITPFITLLVGSGFVAILLEAGGALMSFWAGANILATITQLPLVSIFGSLLSVVGSLTTSLVPLILIIGSVIGIMEILSQSTDGLIPRMSDLTQKFLDWVHSVDWSALSQSIISFIENIDWAQVGDQIVVGLINIFEGLGYIVSQIDWSGLLSAIGGALGDLFAGLSGYISWEDMINQFAIAFRNIGSSIRQSLIDALNIDPRSLLSDIGTQIIDGLEAGINIATFGLYGAWKRLVDNLVTQFKSFLGISSPSSVFMTFGINIVQGLIDGWESLFGSLLKTISSSIDDILSLFSPILSLFGVDLPTGGTTGGATATSNLGSGDKSGSGTVNNYYYGPVYFGAAGEPGAYYDCPSPNPIMTSGSGSLVMNPV
jgi:tape measure domain-containing protein